MSGYLRISNTSSLFVCCPHAYTVIYRITRAGESFAIVAVLHLQRRNR